MKKLLSILASLGLAATASAGVVACGETPSAKVPSKNADVEITTAVMGSDGKTITVTTKAALVEDAKVADFKVSKGTVSSVNGKAAGTTISVVLKDALNNKDALTISAYKSTNVTVTMDAAPAPKPDAPTDNSKVTIKTAAIEKDGKTIDLTTDALVVAATTKDFTVSKGTVASVDGAKGATAVKVVLKDTLTSADKLTISGYATTKAIDVTMTAAPAPAPTDNSKVTIKSATIDATGTIITLTTDKLVVDAKAGDFTLTGAEIASVDGKKDGTTVTITLSSAVAKDAAVTIKGYATQTAITIATDGITA